MTIDKAIEILQDVLDIVPRTITPDEVDALKLGIEALKRIRNARNTGYFLPAAPLPGETEN